MNQRRGLMKKAGWLVALAGAALALAAPPAAQGRAFHGLVAQGNLSASDYARMKNAHVGTLRYSVRWGVIQPTMAGPPNNWAALDAVVRTAAFNGFRVLPILDGPRPGGQHAPPTTKPLREGFANFAAAVADRYGRNGYFWDTMPASLPRKPMKAFQVYNEQNGAYWFGNPSPRSYGKLLRATAKAIRGEARAEIVLGGMFGSPSAPNSITAWTFLKRLYGMRKMERFFDTIAVHPYATSLKGVKRVVGKFRRVARRENDRPKLRITEFGWGSAAGGGPFNVGREGQARMLRKSFRLFENKKREWKLKGINWFSYQDDPGGRCSFCQSSGLVTHGRSLKPSYYAFERAARGM